MSKDIRPVIPYLPLPEGVERATAGRIFDRIAGLYDHARPGYPPEAVATLLRLCTGAAGGQVMEIGCGTGQLTRDLAPSGVTIVCLEPGPSLADLARRNLSGWPNVGVMTTSFEDFDGPPSSFDLVVSATAFHWIDPNLSYAKVAKLLTTGGRLALVTNTHSRNGTHTDEQINEPMRRLHRRLAPEVGDWEFPTAGEIQERATAGGDIAAVWARVERKLSEAPTVNHLFSPPTVMTYAWLATYDREGYLAMLASQSSYALMESASREALLARIGVLIDEHLSGTVTKEYVTVVAVAERRTK